VVAERPARPSHASTRVAAAVASAEDAPLCDKLGAVGGPALDLGRQRQAGLSAAQNREGVGVVFHESPIRQPGGPQRRPKDDIGQPGMPDRPGRGWPVAPGLVTGLGDRQYPAADLHRQLLFGLHVGWPRTVERGRLLLEQLGGPARDGQLGLQLCNPTAGGC
jgi:hypothetical protein